MASESLYSSTIKRIKDGKKCIDEHVVSVNREGIEIKYYHREGINKNKIIIKGNGNSFKLIKIINDATVESTIDRDDLSRELKLPELKFARDYIKELNASNSKKSDASDKTKADKKTKTVSKTAKVTKKSKK